MIICFLVLDRPMSMRRRNIVCSHFSFIFPNSLTLANSSCHTYIPTSMIFEHLIQPIQRTNASRHLGVEGKSTPPLKAPPHFSSLSPYFREIMKLKPLSTSANQFASELHNPLASPNFTMLHSAQIFPNELLPRRTELLSRQCHPQPHIYLVPTEESPPVVNENSTGALLVPIILRKSTSHLLRV